MLLSKSPLLAAALIGAAGFFTISNAAEYRGWPAISTEITAANKTAASRNSDFDNQWEVKRDAWRGWLASAPADERAARWAGLMVQSARVKGTKKLVAQAPYFRDLLMELPDVAEWPEVSRALDDAMAGKPDTDPRVLAVRSWAALLRDDSGAVQVQIAAMEAWLTEALKTPEKPRQQESGGIMNFVMLLGAQQPQPQVSPPEPREVADVLKELVDMLGSSDQRWTAWRLQAEAKLWSSRSHGALVDIPDAVTLLGAERARVVLAECLEKWADNIGSVEGEETRALLSELVQAKIAGWGSKQPWDLIDATQDYLILYPLMTKAAGEGADSSERRKAEAGYYLAQLSTGVDSETLDKLLDLMMPPAPKPPMIKVLEPVHLGWYRLNSVLTGRAERAMLLERMVPFATRPDVDESYWSQLQSLGAELQKPELVLKALARAREVNAANAEQIKKIDQAEVEALIAFDRLEEAITRLRDKTTDAEDADEAWQKIYQLAGRLERKDLQAEALAGLAKAIPASVNSGYWWPDDSYFTYFKACLAEGDGAAVEDMLTRIYIKASSGNYFSGANSLLKEFARLYGAAGRPEDMMAVFKADAWRDGATIKSEAAGDYREPPLSDFVVDALIAAGERDKAIAFLEADLWENPTKDAAYKTLIKYQGKEAESFIRRMVTFNRFEDRPLIWLAQIALDDGRIDEASKLGEEAIAIDPSDGGQGKGNRMRGYAVLAEIRKQQGRTDEAEFFANVVRAIRIAEDGDTFFEDGLTQRGFEAYRKALTVFNDAYCVQSRLAINLAKAGMKEEAAVHYRRAFELMPSSFGRVESHCFGCEHAFEGEAAQSIAEEVFTQLRKEQPERAQVPYLLAYLREEQGRLDEAIELYRAAVALDPDYYNAWKRLHGVLRQANASRAERLEVVRRLIVLDPGNEPGSRVFDEGDWAANLRLWQQQREGLVVPEYPLIPLGTEPVKVEKRERGILGWNSLVSQSSSLFMSGN